MKGYIKILIGILLTVLVGVMMFLVGFGYNYQQTMLTPTTGTTVPDKFSLMWESWGIIKKEYYGDIPSTQTLVHGMIKGMLASLGDPHTILVEPQPAQLEQHNLAGSYGGIGARVESHNGLLVLLPFPTGPAAKAGIQADDALIRIDDKDVTSNMTTDDAEVKLRGDIGSSVKLTLHRVGQDALIQVTLQREKIDIPTVEYHMLSDTTLAYIRISLESGDTAREFEAALKALNQNKPTGVVLDLRNNPGGLFPDPVLSVVGQFVKPNTTVVYERYRDGSEKPYGSTGSQLAGDLPLVILVNGGTASDAEILAGALQDNGRGVLMGEKTFGKGSVQELKELTDKSLLHLTIATWYTPKHNQIEGAGLKPDIAMPLTSDDVAKGADPQLDRAIAYLKTGK
ncbi:MAG: S41 family peptidase [Anaerolineae bacterium]